MIWLNALTTVVAAVVAFTPLYGVLVPGMMGIPPRIAGAAQPGMQIMTFWSAAIGWRRFYQGVLIRQGQTGRVGYGTLARLVSSAGTGIGLALLTSLPGVHIASIGLMAGVVVEAVFITHAVQPTVRKLLREAPSRSKAHSGKDDAVSFRYVARYHMPLAATSLLTLLAQPLIGAGLARMPFPEENLAAWPVVWGILFLFRSPAFALPEAVIALVSESRLVHPLRTFCWRVGWGSSLAMVALACTPVLRLYLRYLAGLPEHLSRFLVPGLLLGIVVPFINSVHSWFRGLLMAARSTTEIYLGMGLNLVVTALVMLLAVLLRAPGVPAGVIAVTVAFLVEIEFLRRKVKWRNPESRIQNPEGHQPVHSEF
jgi:progressive ankylosis protein